MLKRCRRGHALTQKNSRQRLNANGRVYIQCRQCTNHTARLRYKVAQQQAIERLERYFARLNHVELS